MRLASLLAALTEAELERLATEHVRTDEKLPRLQLCNFLEGALRSYRFVNDFITNRQPPTFALLTLLLDAPGYELPIDGFSERVMQETKHVADLIARGDLLARDDQLRLYRRALYEARRNDLDVNSSEAAILGVLRRESGIAQVEHFLIEHHQDLREFWDKEDCLAHEQNALQSAGLIFVERNRILIAEEVAPAIWQTLGIDMPTESARRLLGHLSSAELAAALEGAGARTAGSKDARVERILVERIQPRVVFRSVGLQTLRDICRETGAPIAGNKDDLIERIVGRFMLGKDQEPEELVEPPRKEPRQLDEARFEMLFSFLLQQELADILRRFPDLRQSGTKDVRIKTLLQGHLAEQTLLSELMNRDLENILHRLGVRLGGSKSERVMRIIDYFVGSAGAAETPPSSVGTSSSSLGPTLEASPEILLMQELFRQKASSPQTSLQPWLEEVLEAPGLVRCYATEDANPTKQLKNKLSQASAARGGVLVLALAGEDPFSRASEALVERWITNDEWPKSVTCVALAYPLGAPAIHAIIEWTDSPWPTRIRDRIFASAKVIRAKGYEDGRESHVSSTDNALEAEMRLGTVDLLRRSCIECRHDLPTGARFCPSCGTRTSN